MNQDHIPALGMAAAVMLALKSTAQIDQFITILIEMRDEIDGDSDLEDNDDREASDGDGDDAAYVEWHTMRGSQKAGHNLLAGLEDDEDDDPREDDSFDAEHDGREPDDGY